MPLLALIRVRKSVSRELRCKSDLYQSLMCTKSLSKTDLSGDLRSIRIIRMYMYVRTSTHYGGIRTLKQKSWIYSWFWTCNFTRLCKPVKQKPTNKQGIQKYGYKQKRKKRRKKHPNHNHTRQPYFRLNIPSLAHNRAQYTVSCPPLQASVGTQTKEETM